MNELLEKDEKNKKPPRKPSETGIEEETQHHCNTHGCSDCAPTSAPEPDTSTAPTGNTSGGSSGGSSSTGASHLSTDLSTSSSPHNDADNDAINAKIYNKMYEKALTFVSWKMTNAHDPNAFFKFKGERKDLLDAIHVKAKTFKNKDALDKLLKQGQQMRLLSLFSLETMQMLFHMLNLELGGTDATAAMLHTQHLYTMHEHRTSWNLSQSLTSSALRSAYTLEEIENTYKLQSSLF